MNFEEISEKVKKISKDTVAEVQRLNEVRKLHMKISETKKQINEVYVEMGKKLFEQYKDAALEGYEDEIRTVIEKMECLEGLKLQVRDMKGVVLCPCCNMEVAAGEKFCSNCGNKMPEIVEEAEAEAEEVAEDAAEIAEEAAEAVEEAVEAVTEAVEEAAEEAAETVEEAVEAVAEAVEEEAEKAEETAE